jgi:hypothetical protein
MNLNEKGPEEGVETDASHPEGVFRQRCRSFQLVEVTKRTEEALEWFVSVMSICLRKIWEAKLIDFKKPFLFFTGIGSQFFTILQPSAMHYNPTCLFTLLTATLLALNSAPVHVPR